MSVQTLFVFRDEEMLCSFSFSALLENAFSLFIFLYDGLKLDGEVSPFLALIA